jgi:predicted DNA-binding transcriptional regulator YafY
MLEVLYVIQFLKLSIENQVPIEIIYLSKCGTFSQRKVKVKKLTTEKIVAYCYLRNQIRSFSLDRVLSASWSKRSNAS